MRWVRNGLVAPMGAIALLGGANLLFPSQSLAPAVETSFSKPPQLPVVSSLDELYQVRDRLKYKLYGGEEPSSTIEVGLLGTRDILLQKLQAVEILIQVQENAVKNFQLADDWVAKAAEVSRTSDDSLESIKTVYEHWQRAINSLESIPEDAFIHREALQKLAALRPDAANAMYAYDAARSAFLREIAERSGLPAERIFITVCHLDGECRRWQGNTPPASPASLIKVPIAMALMEKVTKENISLDTEVLVTRGNYTEDASDIWVGKEYTLRRLLFRMINQSSNIATNQFIDYLGRDYINGLMRDRGYPVTYVNYKMVGQRTWPSNAGNAPNRFTTDELTEQMRLIYRQTNPGDEILIEALASQEDLVLAHDGLRSTRALWLGEKTGQNSKMLGTTYAFSVDGEVYVATVSLNYSGSEAILRRCVKEVAEHIGQNNGFGN